MFCSHDCKLCPPHPVKTIFLRLCKFIPEHAPTLADYKKLLWTYLRNVVGDVNLTFEEMVTVLTQISKVAHLWLYLQMIMV